jgi:uncharacterized damage-inducible protein DinB
MPVSADVLRTHIDFTAWASLRLLNAANELTPEELTHDFHTADHSILGTLAHLFAADRIWLARLRGEPASHLAGDRDPDLPALQKDWPMLLELWKSWGAGLTDELAVAQISYADMKGRPWKQPLWQLILHVVNHGTHHRGQVSGFLRSLGHAPPPTDLVYFYRNQG